MRLVHGRKSCLSCQAWTVPTPSPESLHSKWWNSRKLSGETLHTYISDQWESRSDSEEDSNECQESSPAYYGCQWFARLVWTQNQSVTSNDTVGWKVSWESWKRPEALINHTRNSLVVDFGLCFGRRSGNANGQNNKSHCNNNHQFIFHGGFLCLGL